MKRYVSNGTPMKEIVIENTSGHFVVPKDVEGLEEKLADREFLTYCRDMAYEVVTRMRVYRYNRGFDLVVNYQVEARKNWPHENTEENPDHYTFYWTNVGDQFIILLDFQSPNGYRPGFDAQAMGAKESPLRDNGIRILDVVSEHPEKRCKETLNEVMRKIFEYMRIKRNEFKSSMESHIQDYERDGEPEKGNLCRDALRRLNATNLEDMKI